MKLDDLITKLETLSIDTSSVEVIARHEGDTEDYEVTNIDLVHHVHSSKNNQEPDQLILTIY